ncbi:MAG TPA: helix-turn-helix domain-containing protein [Candidatus Acidoferrales bacterium]
MEKLLSAKHVADHLGIHIKTLYRLLRENRIALTFVQIHARTIAFKPSELERYIKSHEVLRDGSGKPKKRKPAKKVIARIMTDEEAREFFKGVGKNEDGSFQSMRGVHLDD